MPLQLVSDLLLVMFALQTLLLLVLIPETGSVRRGALASLRPRITVPRHVRRPFALITPVSVANWALGGFFLSSCPRSWYSSSEAGRP